MRVRTLEDLIGNTPLLRINSASDARRGIHAYGKLEALNPASSVKDRSARQLLAQATLDHGLTEGWTIVESTSGNMGHALAMLCAIRKLNFICILDPKTPKGNIALVKAFGGTVRIVSQPDETGSYQKKRIALARAIAAEMPNCINLDQYNNPAAIDAHFTTTGPEIYEQTAGMVDVLIGSASTGSHLSGTARYLKSRNPDMRVIGVEPAGSVVFGGEYKPYLQNGSGLSFRPGNILTDYVDEVIKVSDADAFSTCRRLAREEGLLLGGSSGSVVHAARVCSAKCTGPCNIVVILPDNGLKYLETIYDDQWLQSQGLSALVAEETEPYAEVTAG
ncbi:MAG: cysteine synthase family protein [Gammaproteobacteria bacterium]